VFLGAPSAAARSDTVTFRSGAHRFQDALVDGRAGRLELAGGDHLVAHLGDVPVSAAEQLGDRDVRSGRVSGQLAPAAVGDGGFHPEAGFGLGGRGFGSGAGFGFGRDRARWRGGFGSGGGFQCGSFDRNMGALAMSATGGALGGRNVLPFSRHRAAWQVGQTAPLAPSYRQPASL
jgi:hypothetical protein